MIRRRATSGQPAPVARSVGRRTRRAALVATLWFVLAAVAAGGAFAVTDHVRDHRGAPVSEARAAPGTASDAEPGTAPGAVPMLTAAPLAPTTTSTAGPDATRAGVAEALGTLAESPGLGDRLRADVIDVTSGRTLYSRMPGASTAPASTAKLLDASAILSVRSADDRIVTRVLAGPGNSIVLVGGGDPTLSAAPVGRPSTYAGAARVATLAAQVRHTVPNPSTISRVLVDDSLFTGPTVSPGWAREDVPSSYGASITAAMVDGGRSAPGDVIRSAHPDLDAGRALAVALGRPSIAVSRGSARSGAAVIATVQSAPIATLVDQMLEESDNVIAEMLGRQVALAKGQPPSFTGAARAIRAVLAGLGVDPGTGMLDASGLAAADRLTPSLLARLLTVIGTGRRPELAVVSAALPVAAWSGTLADRYGSGSSAAGGGLIRAKTGTLTGVSTLAGLVRDDSGHLLAFALMADRARSTAAADAALDRLATRLSTCGCQ